MHCSNISNNRSPLLICFRKIFDPPSVLLLLGTPSLLIFNFFWEKTERYERLWFKMFLLECVSGNFCRTSWTRSDFKEWFLEEKSFSMNDYRKQRNLCVSLVRRTKQQYFSSLDLSLIIKSFAKTVKPLFSDKISHKHIIRLTEDGKTVTKDLPVAEIFDN